MNIAGKTYIVTGGTKGFGLAIAQALLAAGARVGIIARSAEPIAKLQAEIGADKLFGVAADVGNRAQVVAAIQKIHGHFGGLDGLVNNAGLALPGRIEDLTEEEVQTQLSVNIAGTIYCCQAVIPLLGSSDNPRIVNIGSASARHMNEMSHLGLYAATKACVERITQELRDEVCERGIGVTLLIPGGAVTEFASGWNFDRLKSAIDAWHSRGPTMDMGMETTDIARAVLQCLDYPRGVAVDSMGVRPNKPVPKIKF
jgi:NAD(P)-dependent dehydrogenase (short-subunit alcohol dehydrogenase family)